MAVKGVIYDIKNIFGTCKSEAVLGGGGHGGAVMGGGPGASVLTLNKQFKEPHKSQPLSYSTLCTLKVNKPVTTGRI